jgi:hypothetical protein
MAGRSPISSPHWPKLLQEPLMPEHLLPVFRLPILNLTRAVSNTEAFFAISRLTVIVPEAVLFRHAAVANSAFVFER